MAPHHHTGERCHVLGPLLAGRSRQEWPLYLEVPEVFRVVTRLYRHPSTTVPACSRPHGGNMDDVEGVAISTVSEGGRSRDEMLVMGFCILTSPWGTPRWEGEYGWIWEGGGGVITACPRAQGEREGERGREINRRPAWTPVEIVMCGRGVGWDGFVPGAVPSA